MKISRTAGRTVRARYLVGSSKCLPRLEKPLQKYPSGEFSKRPAMQGGGVILATPPILLGIRVGVFDGYQSICSCFLHLFSLLIEYF